MWPLFGFESSWRGAIASLKGSKERNPHGGVGSLEASMHTEGDHVVESAVEARAGFLDRPVLVVLAVSCTLVVVAFILAYVGVLKI